MRTCAGPPHGSWGVCSINTIPQHMSFQLAIILPPMWSKTLSIEVIEEERSIKEAGVSDFPNLQKIKTMLRIYYKKNNCYTNCFTITNMINQPLISFIFTIEVGSVVYQRTEFYMDVSQTLS